MALKLSVVGCGYLGATHAACMSSLGFEVIGVDTDSEKIAMLAKGQLPFYEPGLDSLLASEIKTGRLTFTTDFSAVADADVHFICVGTPQSKDGLAADLTYVKSAVAAIAPHLKEGSLVVGKSTVPVGTAQGLRDQLAQSAPHADLAWNPEFLREGFAVEDTLTPNRLVVGVANDRAEEILKEVYKPVIDLGTPWIRADLPTSELVKVAANSFLATKISFINAMAEVCEAAGGDVTVLAKAIGYDPRIGNRFLQAGIGFGGGCLPKDIRAFMARAEELGAKQALEFLREIDAINLRARQRVIDVVRAELTDDLTTYKIAVL
ncbi:MAG: UDP-glucose dehydrogenase family protein, partial [Candidatus Planktophila sp.]